MVTGTPTAAVPRISDPVMLDYEYGSIIRIDRFGNCITDIVPPAGSPDLNSLKIIAVDDDYIERESQRIKRQFNEIFS